MPANKIDWHDSEWCDSTEAVSAYHEGLTADVYPDDEATDDLRWVARVDVTSAVCEWPEVYSLDFCATKDAALTKATINLLKAGKSYHKITY